MYKHTAWKDLKWFLIQITFTLVPQTDMVFAQFEAIFMNHPSSVKIRFHVDYCP